MSEMSQKFRSKTLLLLKYGVRWRRFLDGHSSIHINFDVNDAAEKKKFVVSRCGYAMVTTIIRFDYDSTAVRPPFD